MGLCSGWVAVYAYYRTWRRTGTYTEYLSASSLPVIGIDRHIPHIISVSVVRGSSRLSLNRCLHPCAQAITRAEEHGSDRAGLPDGARWTFLLGNTLLRILGHLPLPDAGRAAWWFTAACQDQHSGSRQESRKENASAAAELGMVLLSELCAKQPAHMTCALLGRWARGTEGSVKKELAELELSHARGIALNVGT